jgi:hypothetical protein
MKFSSKLGVVFGLLLVATFTGSRADDFDWNQQQGPPEEKKKHLCEGSPPCVGLSCVNVDPPVTVVPDGKTGSVIVKSYQRITTTAYGTCAATQSESDLCYSYPGVECATLTIFGLPDCDINSIWGAKKVYSGNCTPTGSQ